jgi:transcriptional regulator with XRE-family HTH domain
MLEKIISDNLKLQRKNRQWSLSLAALETGVSKAMLGQIERQESSPTMATLWKIAKGMQLPLTALIEPHKNDQAYEHKPSISVDGVLDFTVLFSFDPLLRSEMFAHKLAPAKEQFSSAHQFGVIEDIIVISGRLEMLIDNQWRELYAGDTLRFRADQPHGYRNSSNQEVVFHNIIHYPV